MINITDRVLSDLCRQYEIQKDDLKFLGGGRGDSDGTAYTFEKPGKKKVLKILAIEEEKQQDLKTFEERVMFAHYLGENGVGIVYPDKRSDGSLYASCHDEKHVFIAYDMDFCEGSSPNIQQLSTKLSYHWGKLIGKTHRLTKEYPVWKNFSVKPSEYGFQDEIIFFTNWCNDESVKEKWGEMRHYLESLPIERNSYGMIHNDNHHHNIIVQGEQPTLIDIDCMTPQFFVQDITTPMQGIMFDQSGGMFDQVKNMDPLKRYYDYFISGYETENHLEDKWLKEINTFLNYRRLLLFTCMQDYLNTNQPLKDAMLAAIKEPPVIF